MKRLSRPFLPLVLIVLVVVLIVSVNVVDALPPGFIDEGVADGGDQAIKGIFVSNPRKDGKPLLIVARQDGAIYGYEAPDTSTTRVVIADIGNAICNNGPRGILSIMAHPNFGVANPYLFVWYTHFVPNCPEDAITGPSNRLSRFTIDTTKLSMNVNSELILLEAPPSETATHGGGAMTIGNDNFIYLAIGDGGNIKEATNLKNLHGKLIRISLDGKVAPTNPYTPASGGKGVPCRNVKGRVPTSAPIDSVREEIFSYGFRNPFRLGVDPNIVDTVRFAIADVGNAMFEEISYGGTGYGGANYGWSNIEGPCVRNSFTDCPFPKAGGADPFYYYQHGSNGGAVTGAVYVPNSVWPAKFKFMIADYVEGTIVNLIADPNVGCRTCKPPRPSFRNETFHRFDSIVDVFFGPYKATQAMYYISRGIDGQNIRRIRYVGGTSRPPLAKITLSKNNYNLNEAVNLIGSSSSDPDGGTLLYLWKFGDDRTSTTANPKLGYTKLGTYTIELVVTDNTGLSSNDFDEIVVGIPPITVIESPFINEQFSVGQIIRLKGRATDSTTNKQLNVNQLFWEVRLRHAGHDHPFLPLRSGNDFDLFPAPPPEDFMAATNSFLQVLLTAIDSNGVKRIRQRNVFPNKVLLDIDSNPRGLNVLVGGFNVVTPVTVTAWQNQNLQLEVVDQGTNTFQSWNIGGPRVRMYLVPPSNTTNRRIIANFV